MINAITIVGWNLLVVLALASLLFVAGRSSWLARRPAIRHVLWALVLLKLVTPPMVRVPMLPALEGSTSQTPVGPEQHPPYDGWSLPPSGRLSDAAAFSTPAPDSADTASISPSSSTWREVSKPAAAGVSDRAFFGRWAATIAMGLSALGSLFILLTALYQGRQLRRLLRRCSQPCPRETQIAAEVSESFGLTRTPRISLVDGPVSPMLWGGGRQPRLVLPRSLTETLDDRQLRNVIAHELAHFVRWDQWMNAAAFSVCAVFWWFPVAWLARRQLQLASEACCDALAIVVLSHTRKSYAETLMKAVDYVTQARCVQPQLASGFGGTKSLQRRIEMIANPDVTSRLSRRGRVWLAMAAVCLMALPAWSIADPPSGRSSASGGLPLGSAASGGQVDDQSAVHSGVVGRAVQPDRIARVTLFADGTLKLNGRVVDTSAEPLAAKAGPGDFDAATIHVDCSNPPTDFTVPAAAARLRDIYAQVGRWQVKSVYLHSTDETARAVCNAMIEQESQPGDAGAVGSRQNSSVGRALEVFDNQLAMQSELRREWARRLALDLTGLPADDAWLDTVAKAVSQEDYQRFIEGYVQRHGMLQAAANEIVDTEAYLVIDAYYMNAALADEHFTGRLVRLTGSVVRVSKLGDSRYVLELKPLEGRHKTRLLMEFDLDWRSDLAKLQSNYHATVVGLCTGPGSSVEGDAILFRNCRLLKMAEPPSDPRGQLPGAGGAGYPGGFGEPGSGFGGSGFGGYPGGNVAPPGGGAPPGASGGGFPPVQNGPPGAGGGASIPGASGPGLGAEGLGTGGLGSGALGLPGGGALPNSPPGASGGGIPPVNGLPGAGGGASIPGASGPGLGAEGLGTSGLGSGAFGLPGGGLGLPGGGGPTTKPGSKEESDDPKDDSDDDRSSSGFGAQPSGAGSGTTGHRGSGRTQPAAGSGTRGDGGSTGVSNDGSAATVDEARSGRLLFGAGVNSDAGLTGELTIEDDSFGASIGSGPSAGSDASEPSAGGRGGVTTGSSSDASRGSTPSGGGIGGGSTGEGSSKSDDAKPGTAESSSNPKDDR